jgi:phosphoribosylpyrophosphate synthetase
VPSNRNKAQDSENKLLLIAGSAHPALSKEIADNLEASIAQASISRFADGINLHIF